MTATPFETSGNVTLTTNAAEATFIDALVAANPTKVSKVSLGNSAGGRAMYALVFGTGTGAPLLCVNSVHGDETMPREAAITLARDLCETAHPWTTLLTQRKLYLVVNGNPDGRQSLTRPNANGEDINRHYIDLATTSPESVLLADLIHDLVPAAVYDGHEWNGNPGDCYIGIGNFTATDPTIRTASVATGQAVWDALTSFGATVTGWYPRDTPENSIGHLANLLGIPFTLMETAEVAYGDTAKYGQRHDRHRAALGAWLTHMATNAATYAATGVEARARMATKTARKDYFWPIYSQVPIPAAAWPTGDAVATAAAVDAASYTASSIASVSAILTAHGIPFNAGSGVVGLGHDRAALAAFILDPRGLGLGAATRTPPTVTADPPAAEATPAFQLWSNVVG